MNCREFEERLPLLAGEDVPATERAAALAHAAGCPRCRRLWELAEGSEADPGLTDAILRATSGPACARIGDRLLARVDGRLPPEERGLVDPHLEECAACGRLVRALELLAAELPRMAEAEPDVRFTVDVLARTTWAPRRAAPASRGWRALLSRPRIAVEAAWCGALLFYALAGNPAALLDDLRAPAILGRVGAVDQAGDPARPDVTGSLADAVLPPPVDRAAEFLRQRIPTKPEILAAVPQPGAAQRFIVTVDRAGRAWSVSKACARQAGSALRRGDFRGVWQAAQAFRAGIRQCYAEPPAGEQVPTEPSGPPVRSQDGNGTAAPPPAR